MKRFLGVVAGLVGFVGFVPSASAQVTFLGNSVWKDNLSNVYFGGNPNDVLAVSVSGVWSEKALTSDRCGIVALKISKQTYFLSSIQLDGVWKSFVSVPKTGVKGWTCDRVSGQILPKSSTAIVPSSSVPLLVNTLTNTYYVYTGVPLSTYRVGYYNFIDKQLRLNSCGVGVLKHGVNLQFDGSSNILVNQVSYLVSSLPQSTGSPTCRAGQLLLPAGWDSQTDGNPANSGGGGGGEDPNQ